MKATMNGFLVCALGVIVSACGGGSGSSAAGIGTTYSVSGKVPGTLIEAFCSDGSHYSVNSTNDGTTQHPFSLTLPQGVTCRLVMTTNENDPSNKVVTPIRLTKNGSGNIAFTSTGGDVVLGYIDLALGRSAMQADDNNDGVEDNPLDVDVSSANGVQLNITTVDSMDSDGDGIINVYEDDDGDQTPNHDDHDDDGDGIDDLYDNDNNGDGRSDNDLDHDGITNDRDVDDDNDGIADSHDNDDDNDGINDDLDVDDDNDGIDDSTDNDNHGSDDDSDSSDRD